MKFVDQSGGIAYGDPVRGVAKDKESKTLTLSRDFVVYRGLLKQVWQPPVNNKIHQLH